MTGLRILKYCFIENDGIKFMSKKLHQLTPICLQTVENEMQCEVLTEIISIIWKVFHRSCGRGDKAIRDKILSQTLFEDLQLLLAVSHSLLLRCVLESILTFLEKNNYTVDILLRIIDEFPDEYKVLAAGALTHLCRDNEILNLFKQFGGSEKLIIQLNQTTNDQVKLSILVCFQTVTSDDYDILVDMRNLNLVQIILDLLVYNQGNPILVGSMKAFKLIFPPEIFGAFIDVGNYNKDFQSYIPLLKKFNKKLPDQIARNFEQMGSFVKLGSDSSKYIGGYQGKGAFGSVYQVVKGENQYAMKELPLSHFDVTPEQFQNFYDEHSKNQATIDDLVVQEICREVAILKDLDHPNITKYYTSFAEGQYIYIVMELLDGISLADFILSQTEKKQRVKEEIVWNILTQLSAALRYLHVEKRVVHRDLAPSNILIDGDFNLKLADFGLAKKWGTQSASVMKSFVGTILYSCPEIVQSQPYTEKADIWSLGCIIYELMTFIQPFSAGNPLTVAKKIVDGDYEPLNDDFYSPMLIAVIRKTMTAIPKQRPNILELCQMMVPILMQQMDDLRIKDDKNTRELKYLKERVKMFEGTSASGFKGLQGLQINTNNNSASMNTTQQNKLQATANDFKVVNINQESIKKMSADPVANFLQTVNKLQFITCLPPSLKKDSRQIHVENFYRSLFGKNSNGANVKNELIKLNNCSRETINIGGQTLQSLKDVTYEVLSQMIEDILRDNGFYQTASAQLNE
ncbi:serine threonine-protein kinase nek10 [Stylonychia lemnae]|uniref:Serine threonine-protein kinase nek10 n=1 Tax=Stylonychia lemnae TaxID=5949 RepID=A0A077ZWU0_STYLE|nr:serine threonine-protein kinase nek10 [Stylonychia lemnae]|eukprot:CDW74066.1 serine threonine-protein kinase nek10 [Stylonychia lemnae]